MTEDLTKLWDNRSTIFFRLEGAALVIYADVLIFMNTVINFALLRLIKGFLHLRAKTFRLILSSLIGALFALLAVMAPDQNLLSFALKLSCCTAMTMICFGRCPLKEFSKRVTALFVVSLLFGGAMLLFYQLFRPKRMVIINDVVYFHLHPLLVLLISGVLYLLTLMIKRLFSERIKTSVVDLCVMLDGKEYRCLGKVDTGCSLTEPFSGSPVIVFEEGAVDLSAIEKKRVIPYSTLDSSSLMLAAKADSVKINDEEIQKVVYIAVSSPLHQPYRAIINSQILL